MYTHMAAPQRQDPLYGWFRGWGVAVMHEPLQCSKLRKIPTLGLTTPQSSTNPKKTSQTPKILTSIGGRRAKICNTWNC